jgi:N-acyl-D-aspartate/D-glutamate deacylase
LRDPWFRDRFRQDITHPKPGTMFQGNWERIVVSAPVRPENAALGGRSVAEIAAMRGKDPLDTLFDLCLEEDLETGLLGRFLNVDDAGVGPLLKHEAGVIALSDAGAHLIYMCDAGFALHFLAHWVRELGVFDLAEGVRRLTSHQAALYGLIDRGRIAVGAHADMIVFDPATIGIRPAERIADLPGGGSRFIRRPVGLHGVYVNGVRVFDGTDYARLPHGPGHVLDRFGPSRKRADA